MLRKYEARRIRHCGAHGRNYSDGKRVTGECRDVAIQAANAMRAPAAIARAHLSRTPAIVDIAALLQ